MNALQQWVLTEVKQKAFGDDQEHGVGEQHDKGNQAHDRLTHRLQLHGVLDVRSVGHDARDDQHGDEVCDHTQHEPQLERKHEGRWDDEVRDDHDAKVHG